MDEYTKANRLSWDERVPIHVASESYSLESFKAGRCSLKSIELDELGDISGKSMLHLQCHFGMDTLSWAKRGAIVTGVDFSNPAIEQARTLAKDLDIDARFVISSVYDLPQNLTGDFDIVFTSYGVLCWLGDLTRWAEVIAHFLKPGGTFYIVEGHPVANMFDDELKEQLKIKHSYFNIGPVKFDFPWTYTDGDARLDNSVTYEWSHSISEIVTALIKSGLEIQLINEFPFSFHKYLPCMIKGEDGWWRLPNGDERIPFMFSLKAKKKL
jgi:SAM-dependent methyltransferase